MRPGTGQTVGVLPPMARAACAARSRTPARLYLYDPILERLAQDFQDVACALGPCIQKEHAVIRQRHFAGHRHLAAADQAGIRDRVMGGAKGARGDHGGTGAGEACDAVDACGLKGFGQRHRRHDGGEAAYPNPGENPTLSQASISAGLPNDLFSFHDAAPNSLPVPDGEDPEQGFHTSLRSLWRADGFPLSVLP
jgi:hypothetical protein